MLGQTVMTQNINGTEAKVDMSNLAEGTYMLKVTLGETVKTVRVIKLQ
jgi:hypothetical protein